MVSFGKKIAALRKDRKLSQTELAKTMDTSVSVISRYERDEMLPSIETAKKLAQVLETTVGYLLGETEGDEVLKDPAMLQRLQDLLTLPDRDREGILFALDGLLRDAKTRKAYA